MRDRRGTTQRLLAVAAGLPLLAGCLAACSGADRAAAPSGSSSVSDAAAGASASPNGSGTHGAASPRPAGPLTARTLVPALKAAVKAHPSAEMRMTLTGNGQTLRAAGRMRFTRDPAAMIRISGEMLGNGVMELRVVHGSTYLSMPPLTPEGKFVRSGADGPGGPLGSLGQITGPMDPRKSLSAFGHGLKTVDYLGKQPVGGEQLSHYRLTVDTSTAAAKAYGGRGLPLKLPGTLRYDMWLDQRDLVRKLTFDLGRQATFVTTWSRWGQPVSVSAPPKSDIIG